MAQQTSKRLALRTVTTFSASGGVSFPVETCSGHAARRAAAVVNDSARPAAALRGLRPVLATMNPEQVGAMSVAMQATMDATTSWSVKTIAARVAGLLALQVPPRPRTPTDSETVYGGWSLRKFAIDREPPAHHERWSKASKAELVAQVGRAAIHALRLSTVIFVPLCSLLLSRSTPTRPSSTKR